MCWNAKRPASSQKGRWPLIVLVGSSTPDSYSEISIFIICSSVNFSVAKTPKTLDTVGIQPTVSKAFVFYGGDEEDRTLDLTDANRTLSQLSYAPICCRRSSGK